MWLYLIILTPTDLRPLVPCHILPAASHIIMRGHHTTVVAPLHTRPEASRTVSVPLQLVRRSAWLPDVLLGTGSGCCDEEGCAKVLGPRSYC